MPYPAINACHRYVIAWKLAGIRFITRSLLLIFGPWSNEEPYVRSEASPPLHTAKTYKPRLHPWHSIPTICQLQRVPVGS